MPNGWRPLVFDTDEYLTGRIQQENWLHIGTREFFTPVWGTRNIITIRSVSKHRSRYTAFRGKVWGQFSMTEDKNDQKAHDEEEEEEEDEDEEGEGEGEGEDSDEGTEDEDESRPYFGEEWINKLNDELAGWLSACIWSGLPSWMPHSENTELKRRFTQDTIIEIYGLEKMVVMEDWAAWSRRIGGAVQDGFSSTDRRRISGYGRSEIDKREYQEKRLAKLQADLNASLRANCYDCEFVHTGPRFIFQLAEKMPKCPACGQGEGDRWHW
ncbi:uncharacterized protein IL334_007861 [Kwoniella shivajii]|uniref:Uncharacterized protein n=1 Tax=Kwoniella shivajii TaxID=564305 RepID=A0ABZ1DB88_9TREE|nr:hypothetical protein IL334_007861 [Kwoniella shivajii]